MRARRALAAGRLNARTGHLIPDRALSCYESIRYSFGFPRGGNTGAKAPVTARRDVEFWPEFAR